ICPANRLTLFARSGSRVFMNLNTPKQPTITLPAGAQLELRTSRYGSNLRLALTRGMAWINTQKDSEALWARVRLTVDNALSQEWRSGALLGAKAAEAYFVKCDRTVMTQSDIDNGTLVVVIGVAPVKPAE